VTITMSVGSGYRTEVWPLGVNVVRSIVRRTHLIRNPTACLQPFLRLLLFCFVRSLCLLLLTFNALTVPFNALTVLLRSPISPTAVDQAIRTTAAPLPLPPLDDEHEGRSELQPLLLGKSSRGSGGGASGTAAGAGAAGDAEPRTKRTNEGCDARGGGNRPRTTSGGRGRSVGYASLSLLHLALALPATTTYMVLHFIFGRYFWRWVGGLAAADMGHVLLRIGSGSDTTWHSALRHEGWRAGLGT
jgi:hypothetical protein